MNVPQGLKANICFVALTARLKPCPDTKLYTKHTLEKLTVRTETHQNEVRICVGFRVVEKYFAAPLQGAIL